MDPASPTSWTDGGELRKVFGWVGGVLGDEGLKTVRFPLAGGGGWATCAGRAPRGHMDLQEGGVGCMDWRQIVGL